MLAFRIMDIRPRLPTHSPARNPVLDRITQAYPVLSRAERRVADYVLAHPHTLARTPISGITCGAGASAPTVMRFCRSVGFSGLTDLKLGLVAALGKREDAGATARGTAAHADRTGLLDAASDIVTHLDRRVPAAEIAAAQALLGAARTVMCFATHGLLAAATYGRDALLRHGIDARAPEAPGDAGAPGASMPSNVVGLFFCSGSAAALSATMTRYHRHGKGAIVVGDVRIAPDAGVSVQILASSASSAGTRYGSTRLLPHLLVTDLLIDALMRQRCRA